MKKIYGSCVIVGVMSILLSIGGLILYPHAKGYNLPFQMLVISLSYGFMTVSSFGTFWNIYCTFVDSLNSPFFDYLFSSILIISGIGTIWAKFFGKILAYIYAIFLILLTTVSVSIVLPIGTMELIKSEVHGSLTQGFIGGGLVIFIIFILVTLLYPLFLLFFFSRPKIKELFSAKK